MSRGEYWAIACGIGAIAMATLLAMYPQIPKPIGWPIVAILLLLSVILFYKGIRTGNIEFLGERSVRRIENNKIRVNQSLAIMSNSPIVTCEGSLKIGKTMIKLPKEKCIKDGDKYWVVLDGEYKGAYEGQGLLKLKVILVNKQSKSFKGHIPITIPEKQKKDFNPPEIINPLGHRPEGWD